MEVLEGRSRESAPRALVDLRIRGINCSTSAMREVVSHLVIARNKFGVRAVDVCLR